jgi:hypothetical protein
MGTISDKLMRIINTKEDIRQALISKGYDVPTSIPFKEYAKMILDLPCKVDSFPDIEGIVARYSASGLTNEQMAANPVWVDKTGNGHDLQLKNFSWKGMSGVGGYGDENHQTFYKFTLDDYVFIASPPGAKHMNFTFRVTGLQPGNKLTLAFFGTTNTVYGTWNKDGIYTVDADIVEAGKPTYFYNGYGATRGEFTIEILPLYPGALVFDGVDDYGTCDNFPILTKEKGYTVVALRQWITYNPNAISAIATNASDRSFNGAFTFENYNKGAEQTISYGATQISLQYSKSPFSWQTTSKYNGFNIANGNKDATNSLVLGRSYPQRNEFANFAIWELVFLDHDATEEELTKIKDYFVKTYPWLFPDQAWTVTGKTNEDEDRATIANITGNGNDLVLSNFGFAEGSGYGLYAQNYISYAITNRAVYTKTNSSIHVTKSITAGVNFTESARDVTIPSYRIKVTGIQSGQEMIYRGSNNTFLTNIPSDGIYVLPAVENGSNLGFQFVSYTGDCDITIEQIPEYEGYLITDGVDDKVQSYSFTMNEDWTIVGDWELLSNVQINCGIVKAQNVYLYNTANGLLISINNPRSLQSFGTKSLHAICSDGRLYDRNWVEYEYTVDQNFAIVESSLNIGFNLNNYTQIAFKNLGIYNNQILYKDDCIKAYNYLQTLKAK